MVYILRPSLNGDASQHAVAEIQHAVAEIQLGGHHILLNLGHH